MGPFNPRIRKIWQPWHQRPLHPREVRHAHQTRQIGFPAVGKNSCLPCSAIKCLNRMNGRNFGVREKPAQLVAGAELRNHNTDPPWPHFQGQELPKSFANEGGKRSHEPLHFAWGPKPASSIVLHASRRSAISNWPGVFCPKSPHSQVRRMLLHGTQTSNIA